MRISLGGSKSMAREGRMNADLESEVRAFVRSRVTAVAAGVPFAIPENKLSDSPNYLHIKHIFDHSHDFNTYRNPGFGLIKNLNFVVSQLYCVLLNPTRRSH